MKDKYNQVYSVKSERHNNLDCSIVSFYRYTGKTTYNNVTWASMKRIDKLICGLTNSKRGMIEMNLFMNRVMYTAYNNHKQLINRKYK